VFERFTISAKYHKFSFASNFFMTARNHGARHHKRPQSKRFCREAESEVTGKVRDGPS
jgi:hypothetical protein